MQKGRGQIGIEQVPAPLPFIAQAACDAEAGGGDDAGRMDDHLEAGL